MFAFSGGKKIDKLRKAIADLDTLNNALVASAIGGTQSIDLVEQTVAQILLPIIG